MRKTVQTGLIVVLAFGLMAGKKNKKKKGDDEAPAAETTEAAAPADDEMPEAEMAEEEPEPEPAKPNADFDAKVVHADGSTTSGHVIRVERSNDWYAEEGWTDNEYKITVTVEGNGTAKDVNWKDIKSVDIAYLGKSNINCDYDSEYTPLMWTCTMKTKSTANLAEGGTWSISSRHKYKFTFDDGKTEEFWVYKIPARAQESGVADMNAAADKSEVVQAELQLGLQDEVVKMSGSTAVKRIEITAP